MLCANEIVPQSEGLFFAVRNYILDAWREIIIHIINIIDFFTSKNVPNPSSLANRQKIIDFTKGLFLNIHNKYQDYSVDKFLKKN